MSKKNAKRRELTSCRKCSNKLRGGGGRIAVFRTKRFTYLIKGEKENNRGRDIESDELRMISLRTGDTLGTIPRTACSCPRGFSWWKRLSRPYRNRTLNLFGGRINPRMYGGERVLEFTGRKTPGPGKLRKNGQSRVSFVVPKNPQQGKKRPGASCTAGRSSRGFEREGRENNSH